MYCIKNLNYTLTGSFAADEYSFIVLNLFPCKNNTGKKCKPQERLDYYLDGAFFTFQYQNFIFDPNVLTRMTLMNHLNQKLVII